MTGTVSFTETDTVNFPSPPIPDFDDPSEVVGEFTSVYGNTEFAFTVNFFVDGGEEETYTVIEVENTSKPYFMLSEVIDQNSIRLTKNPEESVFPDEYYEYASYDQNWNVTTEQFLFSEEAPDQTSIIEWKQPDVKIINDSYTFVVTYRENQTLTTYVATINIPQTFYWNYVPSLIKFEQEVAESQY